MKKRLKRSTWKSFVTVFLCLFIACVSFSVISFVIISNIKKDYNKDLQELTKEIDSKKVHVYEAISDISGGSEITADKLKYVEVTSEQPQEFYMTKEDMGKIALIDMKAGTQILKGMLTQESIADNLREVEFNSFQINSNIAENDYVDIRIMYPNGENYVVLSKKTIKNLSLESGNCFLWLDAEEISRVSGAIVDCYINEGSKLYTVKYIQPSIQEASKITYTPNTDVINLIKEDPNILQIASDYLNASFRAELEDRLQQFYSEHENQVNWDDTGLTSDSFEGSSYSGSESEISDTSAETNTEEEEEIYYVD